MSGIDKLSDFLDHLKAGCTIHLPHWRSYYCLMGDTLMHSPYQNSEWLPSECDFNELVIRVCSGFVVVYRPEPVSQQRSAIRNVRKVEL